MAEKGEVKAASDGMPAAWMVRAGLGLVLGATVIVALWTLLDVDARSGKREDARNARAEYAEVQPRCVGSETFRGMLRCMVEEAAANHEQRHNEADLKAQDDVAGATVGLFWLGVIGVGISAVGIWFLYANLQAVRDELSENREKARSDAGGLQAQLDKMEAQTRCYLGLENVQISLGRKQDFNAIQSLDDPEPADEQVRWPVVYFDVRNHGASPAYAVAYHFSVKYMALFRDDEGVRAVERQSARRFPFAETSDNSWGETVHTGQALSFRTLCRFRLNDVERLALQRPRRTGSLSITLVIALRYRDVFDKTITEDHCLIADISAERMDDLVPMTSLPLIFFETDAERRRIAEERAS